ncbi:tRNA (guanosine(37)-N1)-methyltransferase TrmD [Roseivirga sp. BDSF3-8]|uniref:tRNA (guanosine(37)-N1)-methyltransferase TrmD n=1 Tax=Roseivirga sp. BDSF3-8 TaxID=3241598 RepID=UPI0035327A28
MRIDIITVVPELLSGPFSHSILKRAIDKGLVEVNVINLREYATNKHKQVDDYAYGGGAGMVLMAEPVVKCIEKLQEERTYDDIIYMSPDGEPFIQRVANQLALKKNLILLCGHYKGIDERIREHFITREISIGDFVLSGGELAAAVVADAVIRLLPGVISDETSALTDSFQDGLVAPPVYTRPADFRGHTVPKILLSGHEAKIEAWRFEKAVERTKQRRPDLFNNDSLNS